MFVPFLAVNEEGGYHRVVGRGEGGGKALRRDRGSEFTSREGEGELSEDDRWERANRKIQITCVYLVLVFLQGCLSYTRAFEVNLLEKLCQVVLSVVRVGI